VSEKLVVCRCQHCGGGIEFDSRQNGEAIDCPHCQIKTVLLIPASLNFKGTVLDYSIQANKGVISGDNGQRYSFQGAEWKDASNHPTKGCRIDFVAIDQNASEIYFIGKSGDSSIGKRPSEYQGLYRSSDEKTIGGVCGGLAHKYGVSRGGWQMILIVVTIFLFGVGLLFYIIMCFGFKALPTKGIKFSD